MREGARRKRSFVREGARRKKIVRERGREAKKDCPWQRARRERQSEIGVLGEGNCPQESIRTEKLYVREYPIVRKIIRKAR